MNDFKIGWAEESIVPDKRAMLPGQMYERISDHVESEITVTAMAVESGAEKAIIVSCDIIKVSDALMRKAREKLARMCKDVPPEAVIIGATHTHTSLSYIEGESADEEILNEFLPEERKYTPIVRADNDVMSRAEALELISEKTAMAAAKAWDSRKKAMYSHAFGRAAVGFCRRAVYDDGSAEMWGDTNTANFVSLEGGNDSGVEIVYTFDEHKKLTGVIANVACPAQILEHKSFISSDYWGKVKEYIRRELGEGIYLLALCGAAGDQCPRDLVRWVNSDEPVKDPNISRPNYIERKADPSMFDLSGCRLAGRRIANEIIGLYYEANDITSDAEFIHKSFVMDLQLRKASKTEYEHAVREIEYYVNKNKDKAVFDYKDKAAVYVHVGVINRYRRQQNEETVPVEAHIIRLGDIAIATNPFELFLDYGNRIRARSHAKQTFIMQLACGGYAYLPTEKAECGGHYSAYITSGHVGHEGGDMLVRKTIDEINKMFRG